MLKKVGRFEVKSDGNIHLTCKEDETEFFGELDRMSKKYLKDIPPITYDYEDSKFIKKEMI